MVDQRSILAVTQLQLFTTPDPVETGRVYLATNGYCFKIGYTTRPVKHRGGELKADIIFSVPGTVKLEQRWLTVFHPWSLGQEWFSLPNEAKALGMLRDLIIWGGGTKALVYLDHVIANNLRVKRAA
jgi:hypothetical protein